MIVTPYYNCRNCRKTYPGNTQEISSAQIENLIRAAGFTLGSSDHIFRFGGKTIQLSDLHRCSETEIGIASLVKIKVDK